MKYICPMSEDCPGKYSAYPCDHATLHYPFDQCTTPMSNHASSCPMCVPIEDSFIKADEFEL